MASLCTLTGKRTPRFGQMHKGAKAMVPEARIELESQRDITASLDLHFPAGSAGPVRGTVPGHG
jgi:hypothetical protein